MFMGRIHINGGYDELWLIIMGLRMNMDVLVNVLVDNYHGRICYINGIMNEH
jgi:hypothetical protein